MLNQVCVLTIRVQNMEEAISFYTDVLDFEIEQHYGKKIVSLKHPNIPIVLEEHSDIDKHAQNNVVFAIQSDDIEQDSEKLKSEGVNFVLEKPEPCPPGRYTIIKDPSGNQIELVEFSKVSK